MRERKIKLTLTEEEFELLKTEILELNPYSLNDFVTLEEQTQACISLQRKIEDIEHERTGARNQVL